MDDLGGTLILGNRHIPTYLQNIFWATFVWWMVWIQRTNMRSYYHTQWWYIMGFITSGMIFRYVCKPSRSGNVFSNHQHMHSQMYMNPFIKGTFPETHPTCTYFQASPSCNISSHIIFGKSICFSYLNSHLYYLESYLNPHVGWWIPFFICGFVWK